MKRKNVGAIAAIAMMLAAGQVMADVYVDFGNTVDTPESTFAGAAQEAGVWNTVATDGSPLSMVNTDGTSSGVTLTVSTLTTGGWISNTGSSPLLIEDYFYTRSVSITVNNLANGNYNLYLYGAPHYGIFDSGTWTINGDTENQIAPLPAMDTQTVTEWVEDTHYKLAQVSVTDGTLVLAASNSNYFGISGLQLEAVPEPATFAFIGVFGGGLLAVRRIFAM